MKLNKPFALNETGGRTNNEDSIFPRKGEATENDSYFLVCDGMGGHENGEVASGTVCESFGEYLKTTDAGTFDTEVFNQALSYAYDRLDEKDQSPAEGKKMGTTLTFLCLNDKGALMAHIGDSRIYHLRKTAEGAEILYKSQDHSLVNDLIRAEVITPEEAENHPKKNVITRAMQPHMEKRSKADIYTTWDVQAGDSFFLCSDGVLESVSDGRLIDIVAADTSTEEKIQAVCSLCEKGSKDNFSAYLIEIAEGVAKETVAGTAPALSAEPQVATEIVVTRDTRKTYKLLYAVILFLAILTGFIIWNFLSAKENKEPEENRQEPKQEKLEPARQDMPQPAPPSHTGNSRKPLREPDSNGVTTDTTNAGKEVTARDKPSLVENVENAVIASEAAKRVEANNVETTDEDANKHADSEEESNL